jgi:hypothetical protein
MRNAGHKARQAQLFAQAHTDAERQAVAFAWLRSSAALLTRRRPPPGFDKEVHRSAAARLVREMADHIAASARAIDKGDYDAKEAA